MFYNCLSTVVCGPKGPTEDSGNTEGDVIDWAGTGQDEQASFTPATDFLQD